MTAGLIQGQVIGDHNVVTLNFYGDNGAHVARAMVQPPSPQPLPRPVHLLPPPFPRLVDRKAELAEALDALAQGVPLEIHGPNGIGKSTLLRVLAHHPSTVRPPDGVVFHGCQGEPSADVVQALFQAFYELPAGAVCADPVVRRHLGAVRALVVLDDAELERGDLEVVRNAAAGCTFVLASKRPRLYGEGRALALGGLGADDAHALVAGWLGRALSAAERREVETLRTEVGGNALLLKQAMAAPARRSPVLALLGTMAPTAVSAPDAAAILGRPEAPRLLSELEGQGLVERAGDRYRPTGAQAADGAMAGRVVSWAAQAASEGRLDDPGRRRLLVAAVGLAAAHGRNREAIQLARAVEAPLALGGQTGSWALVLEQALVAARSAGDTTAEAWAMHELGTRALAFEDYGAAGALLGRALELREAAGDQAGAAVTRNNVEVLHELSPPAYQPPPRHEPPQAPPPPPPPLPERPAAGGRSKWPLVIGALAVAVLVAVGGVLATRGGDEIVQSGTTTTPSTEATTTSTTLVALAAASLDQPRIAQGAAEQIRTLRGSGLRAGVEVTAGAGVVISVDGVAPDGSTATLRIAAARAAAPGSRDLVVTDGDRSASCPGCLEVTRRPVITSLKPDRAVVGSTVNLTISGRSFGPAATVTVSGTGVSIRSYRSRTGGAIEVVVVVDGSAATTRRSVTVDNGDGGATTCTSCFSPYTID